MRQASAHAGKPVSACRIMMKALLAAIGFIVTAGSILSGVCTVGCSASQTESFLPAPEKALLVLSRVNWGCLAGQEIVRDVSGMVDSRDGQAVRVEEILNPEDREDQLSLDLFFPIGKTEGTGYYLWRLRVSGKGPENPGWLEIDHAGIQASEKEQALIIRARASGTIRASFMYAPAAGLSTGLFTCAAAGLFEANPIPFIPSHEIIEAKPAAAVDSREFSEFRFSAGDAELRQAKQIILASQLLKALDKQLGLEGKYAFYWDAERVNAEELDRISRTLEGSKAAKFRILVRLQGREGQKEIIRSPEPFNPVLHQMISVREKKGAVTGGEIQISTE